MQKKENTKNSLPVSIVIVFSSHPRAALQRPSAAAIVIIVSSCVSDATSTVSWVWLVAILWTAVLEYATAATKVQVTIAIGVRVTHVAPTGAWPSLLRVIRAAIYAVRCTIRVCVCLTC